MANRVQAKGSPIEPSLFHFSLIKLLVTKQLEKKEQSWQEFFIPSGWMTEPSDNQANKKNTPLVAIKESSPIRASSIKNPLNKRKLVDKRSAKKLHFSPKV